MKSVKIKLISKYKIASKRGNALMLVLIVFLVISVLAVAMLAVAAGENRMVIAQERIDQAYYTARAAVQATYDWIDTHYNARDQMAKVIPPLTGYSNHTTSSGVINGNDYTLEIWRSATDPDLITITARGTSGGLSATATMTLRESVSSYYLFEDAIYSRTAFGKDAGGGGGSNVVIGSVSTGASEAPDTLNVFINETDAANKTNLQKINLEKDYIFSDVLPGSEIIFPAKITGDVTKLDTEFLNSNAPVDIDGVSTVNLNAWYGDLTLGDGSGQDIINIINVDEAGQPIDIYIKVDSLTILSQCVIKPIDNNGGRIFIFVLNEIYCDAQFGIDGSYTQPNVFLICSGTGDIVFSGSPVMNAYIYAPDVNVQYSGGVTYYGAIIADIYGWAGNITVVYKDPGDLTNSPFASLVINQSKVNIYDKTWQKD